MRMMLILIGVASVGGIAMLINEFGKFVEEINPYAPEDFPKDDPGDSLNDRKTI